MTFFFVFLFLNLFNKSLQQNCKILKFILDPVALEFPSHSTPSQLLTWEQQELLVEHVLGFKDLKIQKESMELLNQEFVPRVIVFQHSKNSPRT